MGKVKRLDLEKISDFMANGHKYVISEYLSIERWRKLEDLQVFIGFGRDFKSIYEGNLKIHEALQTPKVADAVIINHNLLLGIKDKLDQRHTPMLMMAALFINREDEDTADYDEKLINEKINDWAVEGYAVYDFFQFAWRCVQGFTDAYNSDLESTFKTLFQEQSNPSKKNK